MFPWVSGVIWECPEYTPHKVLLRCKCGKRYWRQKNIGYIGARTIFHFPGGCDWMKAQFDGFGECDCPTEDLFVDEELMRHIVNCDECKRYGY